MRTYEATPGENVQHAAEEMAGMALANNDSVECQFNDIILTTSPCEPPNEIVTRYHTEMERRRAEYIASPEYKRRQEEAEQKERERQNAVNALLAGAPEHMTPRDADAWAQSCKANSDGYGGAVMTYAERWARLMEARMAKGEKIADIADECSYLADDEGITGFMYGCAVGILSKVWQHGEALRLWHNLKTQLKDEGERANDSGGVLNPALLNIG